MDSVASSARTDMQGVAAAYQRGEPVRVFRHSGGWSAQCDSGLLQDGGSHTFAALEPLLQSLKANGVDCVLVEA